MIERLEIIYSRNLKTEEKGSGININQINQLSHVFKELYKRSNIVYQSIYCQYCLMSQYYETRIDKDTHNKHLEYIFDQTENLMCAIRSSAGLSDEDADKDYELYDKAYAGIQSDIKLFTDWGYLPGNKSNELYNIWNIFKDFENLKDSLEKLFR